MSDINNFIIKRYLRTDDNPGEGELVEVIEVDLPDQFDFNALEEYLESREGFELTNSYYVVERRYIHEERGAGASIQEIILNIWEGIPDLVKGILIEKLVEFAIAEPIKVIKKITRRKTQKEEVNRIKKAYGIKCDMVETIEIEKTDITITTYKKY